MEGSFDAHGFDGVKNLHRNARPSENLQGPAHSYPSSAQATAAAAHSPANFRKYVPWASAFFTSRPQSKKVWYVLSVSSDSWASS